MTITSVDHTKTHELKFDDIKHKYWLDGVLVPGATTVGKQGYPKSEALIKWQVKQGIEEYETGKKLKAAASIGTFVHDYAFCRTTGLETITLAEKINANIDRAKIMNGCHMFDTWYAENQEDELLGAEDIIAAPSLQVAGKYDLLVKKGSRVILRDYKTASGFYIDQFLQLELYAIQFKEWLNIDVDALEIIRFGKNADGFETKLVEDKKFREELRQQSLRNVGTYWFRRNHEKLTA